MIIYKYTVFVLFFNAAWVTPCYGTTPSGCIAMTPTTTITVSPGATTTASSVGPTTTTSPSDIPSQLRGIIMMRANTCPSNWFL